MGEWKYEMINHKEFSDINDFLEEEFNKAENNQALFLVHRKKIISIAVEVLEELKEENLFAEMNIDFVLMFGISEFDDKDLEKEIVKRLNDKDKYLEFERWINS